MVQSLKLFIKEPFWMGMISQALALLATWLIVQYGVIWSFYYVLFSIAIMAVPFIIPLLLKRRRYKKQHHSLEGFQWKLMQKPVTPLNFTAEQERERAGRFYYDGVVYAYHIMHFVTFFVMLYGLSITQSYTMAFCLALVWGLLYSPAAESFSHEFVHRRSLLQQMLGGSIWASFCYGTFLSEHCMGHHVHVSTPEDASSAPKGMTIYRFIPQAIIRNVVAGFRLEAKRLKNRNLPAFSIRNRILWLTLLSVALLCSSIAIAGTVGFVFFVAQTLLMIITIEVANYVMHYGLQRRRLENGRYERVSPLHSWNREGPSAYTSANLVRHSDHHAFPRRPYQILRGYEESPQLPLPYELLLYLVYVPKWFFAVMDPVVDSHMEKLAQWRAEGIDDYERVMGSAA